MYIGLHVKYLLLLSEFNENLNFLYRFLEKYSKTKFHENSPSECRVVPCGRTDRNDEAKTVAFRNFANAPSDCNIETCRPSNYPVFHAALRTANYRRITS
jgi:hypothetical protein